MAESDEDVETNLLPPRRAIGLRKLQPLPLSQKLGYSLPALANAVKELPVTVHLNQFYTDEMGLPAGSLAIVSVASRALDTTCEPLLGWLSDHVRTRWGRRKPVLAVAAPLTAIMYFLLFHPPAALIGKVTHCALWFFAMFTLYRLMPLAITHAALGPEITRSRPAGECAPLRCAGAACMSYRACNSLCRGSRVVVRLQ
jgi:Na+/melibiose symporter-like transporter